MSKSLQSCKDISYTQYRNTMKNGDVLLFRGKGLISFLIRKRTRSPYSHAGIVAWWNDRLMVLEAVGKGVRAVPLSSNVKKYHGGVDYFQAVDQIDENTRKDMVIFAQEQLGKEYNLSSLLKYAAMHLLGMSFKRPGKDSKAACGQYFCSQYVSDIYASFNHDLVEKIPDHYTSPKVLGESPKLRFVGSLKKDDE